MASQASASTQSSSSSSSQSKAGPRRLSAKALVQFNFTQPIRLHSDNYLVWKSQFLPAIRGHKLLGHLDGSLPCPELDPDDPASAEDVEDWQSQDEIIQQHMYSSITKEVRTQLVRCTTSHQSWRALEELFASPSESRILQLQIQLHGSKKASSSMSDFFSRMKKIANELGAAGHQVSEKEQIRVLLAGVGSEYDSVVSSVVALPGSFNLRDVQALLLNQEHRLATTLPQASTTQNSSANYANNSGNNKESGSNGTQGNGKCGGGNGKRRGRFYCQLCGKPGHTAAYCYHRFDKTFRPPSQNRNGNGAYTVNPTGSVPQPFAGNGYAAPLWYVDSGASAHVTNNLKPLSQASEYGGNYSLIVGFGNGLRIPDTSSVTLHSKVSNLLALNNVLP